MAMDLTGVMIFCEDIKAMTVFYRDVVGLKPVKKQPFAEHKFYQFASKKGCVFNLHNGTKPNGGRQKLQFWTDDLEGLVARLRQAKHRFRPPVPEKDGMTVFDFRDPEGNRVQVYAKLPAKMAGQRLTGK